MVMKEKDKEKIRQSDRKLLELLLQIERLDHNYKSLLKELNFTRESLKEYVENPDNFSPSLLEYLKNEKKQLDDKLNSELNHVPDVNKTQQTLSEKGQVQQHWLFVR